MGRYEWVDSVQMEFKVCTGVLVERETPLSWLGALRGGPPLGSIIGGVEDLAFARVLNHRSQ